jgi:DNA polymerase-3 subunit gamma/tau
MTVAGSVAPAGPVDSWATVTIPNGETDVSAWPAASVDVAPSSAQREVTNAVAIAVAEAPAAASDPAEAPDDADAPPEDVEPPFDPSPPPEIVIETARAVVSDTPVDGRVQRYGESVVREVLGATFLEEIEAPGRPGFGERG